MLQKRGIFLVNTFCDQVQQHSTETIELMVLTAAGSPPWGLDCLSLAMKASPFFWVAESSALSGRGVG